MIRFYSICYNNTPFIELQVKCLKHFIAEPHEFVVVNNGEQEWSQILEKAAELGVHHIPVFEQRFDTPGHSHQQALQYTLKVKAYNDDISVFLDSDVFLLKPLSVEELLDRVHIAGLAQGQAMVRYFWPGCLFLRSNALPDFGKLDLRGALINPLNPMDFVIPDERLGWRFVHLEQQRHYMKADSGGLLSVYMLSHPEIMTRALSLELVDPTRLAASALPSHAHAGYQPDYHSWIIDGRWLHSGRGTNWDAERHFEAKNEWVANTINEAIKV
jgi:hypothetical protein